MTDTPAIHTALAAVMEDDPCHPWPGALRNGYGAVGNDYAHRVVYTARHGEIPEGLQIDHLCRNRACVNPNHLEAVTQQENCQRAHRMYDDVTGVWVCKRGHRMTTANTYRRGTHTECRACRTDATRRYRDRAAS